MDAYLIECKHKIMQHAKVLNDKVEVMKSSITCIDNTISRVNGVHDLFKQEINESVEKAYQAIQDRKNKLVHKSRTIRDKKINSLKKQQKMIQAYAEQLQKTAEAFEGKASMLEPYDTVDSMTTFEFVANELQLKVPELWPCCNEAVVKNTDISDMLTSIKKSGKIETLEEEFSWDHIWSIVSFVALAVMVVGVSMCVLGIRHNTTPTATTNNSFIQANNVLQKPYPVAKVNPHLNMLKCDIKDMQGVINWIGKREGNSDIYNNPFESGKIRVRYSSIFHRSPGNDIRVFGSRDSGHVSTHNIPFSWFSFDFFPYSVHPLRYTLKNGESNSAIRSWELQASNDHVNWVVLRRHVNDTSLPNNDPCATATWHINNPHQTFRYFRVMQTGTNSEGSHYLSLGDIELYGFVNRDETRKV
jgi:hypothetical protein